MSRRVVTARLSHCFFSSESRQRRSVMLKTSTSAITPMGPTSKGASGEAARFVDSCSRCASITHAADAAKTVKSCLGLGLGLGLGSRLGLGYG